MEKKIAFGNWEVIMILVNLIIVKIFINYPRRVAEAAGPAGWILAIYFCLLALIGFIIISKLYEKFEGKDLLDLGEYVGGNIGRILIGLIILTYLIFIGSLTLRMFGEMPKIITLVNSPISFVIMFFVFGMVIATYNGIESIARIHSIVMPIIILASIILMIGITPYLNFTLFLPILGTGAKEIFIGGLSRVSNFHELIFLFLLFPFVKYNKNFKSTGYKVIGISSFFLIISAVVYIGIVSYPNMLERMLPMYHLSRLIRYGRFFQRVESIFLVVWIMCGLLYLSTFFFFGVSVFKKTFKLEYYKPLIPAFTIIFFNISLMPSSSIDSAELLGNTAIQIGWIIAFALPIILLIVARFIKKKKTSSGAKS